ncbi:hypothetical protein RND81_01G037400 [Saponaria officinalis]|uniref:Uncharacterized protein n=1 Tax=Saponaria officinalis TaxID=3572 RepID=A0AAW1N8Q3_SAPOF
MHFFLNQTKEEPWIADVTYGVTDGDHKWEESEYDPASPLYLDSNFEEAFKIDDVASVFHYEPIARLDRLKSNMTKEHNNEDRDFNGLLCEDEIANLTLAVYLPQFHEDHIMDANVDFAKKVSELDFKFCDDELNFGNFRTVINCPETSNQVARVSELSVSLPKGLSSTACETSDVIGSECRHEPLNNQFVEVSELSVPLPKGLRITACEMHDVVESKCRHEPLIEDELYLSSSEERTSNKCSVITDTQKICCANDEQYSQSDKVNLEDQSIKVEDFLMNRLSTNSPFGEKAVRSRQKRACHPPKKYAELLPIPKPRRGRPKKYPMSSSKDKNPGVMSQKNLHGKSSKRKAAKVSKGNLELDSDDDYRPYASCFRNKKYNKQWTLDEVVKVVDGITHCGLGQWTAIQRKFFSSTCRTPTDIRDKWRNLVKTNFGKLKNKRKVRFLLCKLVFHPLLPIIRYQFIC